MGEEGQNHFENAFGVVLTSYRANIAFECLDEEIVQGFSPVHGSHVLVDLGLGLLCCSRENL
jgi:hypothetical protein